LLMETLALTHSTPWKAGKSTQKSRLMG